MRALLCLEGPSVAYARSLRRIRRHYNTGKGRQSEATKDSSVRGAREDNDLVADVSGREEKPILQWIERPLPLSPIVDPKAIDARTKWSAAKPAAKGPPQNDFQAKLLKNPYAQALATPVRLCAMTKARLPNYFLVDFNSIKHPETKRPWFFPEGFERKPRKGSITATTIETIQGQTIPEDPLSLKLDEDEVEATKAQVKVYNGIYRRKVPGRALVRYSLYRNIRNLIKSQPRLARNTWATLLHSTANRPSTTAVNQHVFREDMDDFLLDTIRVRVLKEFEVIRDRGNDYMSMIEVGLEKAPKLKQAGAILCFSEKGETSLESCQPLTTLETVSNNTIPVMDVELLPVIPSSGGLRSLAVYDLPRLLGKEHMEELRESLGLGTEVEYALLKSKRATMDLQSWLWKLQGYLHT